MKALVGATIPQLFVQAIKLPTNTRAMIDCASSKELQKLPIRKPRHLTASLDLVIRPAIQCDPPTRECLHNDLHGESHAALSQLQSRSKLPSPPAPMTLLPPQQSKHPKTTCPTCFSKRKRGEKSNANHVTVTLFALPALGTLRLNSAKCCSIWLSHQTSQADFSPSKQSFQGHFSLQNI